MSTQEQLRVLHSQLPALAQAEELAAQTLLACRMRAEQLSDGQYRNLRTVEAIISDLRRAEAAHAEASSALSQNHKERRRLLEAVQ